MTIVYQINGIRNCRLVMAFGVGAATIKKRRGIKALRPIFFFLFFFRVFAYATLSTSLVLGDLCNDVLCSLSVSGAYSLRLILSNCWIEG